ncbi:MAG: 50S ribosomal protein L18e [archaeon]
MAKKLETVLLIASLEKASKKTEKALWSSLAEKMQSPKRNKVLINLDKLNKLALLNKGKTLLVPGKVLSQGELHEKVVVVAVSASETAKAKIKAKGEFILLKDFAEKCEKVKVADVIIVK